MQVLSSKLMTDDYIDTFSSVFRILCVTHPIRSIQSHLWIGHYAILAPVPHAIYTPELDKALPCTESLVIRLVFQYGLGYPPCNAALTAIYT